MYLILGIEDKTKKPVGISDEVTEERCKKEIADTVALQLSVCLKTWHIWVSALAF